MCFGRNETAMRFRSSTRMWSAKWPLLAFAIAGLACATSMPSLAQVEQHRVVADPTEDALASEPMIGTAIRIVRDVNNDAKKDVLVATPESCGQQGCVFRVYLRVAKRRYTFVGDLNAHAFGYRLVPIAIGTAQWTSCSASGGTLSRGIANISFAGIRQRWLSMQETESERVCKSEGRFNWEECDFTSLPSVRSCVWKEKKWN